jgi:membrane protease YdiL (CAAX protease family)
VLSQKNWKPEAVLRLVLGVFLCVCLGGLATALLRGAQETAARPSVWLTLVSLLCFQGATLLFVWQFVRDHESTWGEMFGLSNQRVAAVARGIGLAALFLPVGLGLKWLVALALARCGIEVREQAAVELLLSASVSGRIALGLAAVILAPLAEEFLFRGVLYPAVKQAGFPRLALWGTAALFAVIHFNLVTLVPLLLLALALTWLYETSNNLLAPIAAHTAFNALNFGLFFLSDEVRRSLPTP